MKDRVTDALLENILQSMPMRRMGSTEYLVHALLFVSENAGWVTGQILTNRRRLHKTSVSMFNR